MQSLESLRGGMGLMEELGYDAEDLLSLQRILDSYVRNRKPEAHATPAELRNKNRIDTIIKMVENKLK